MTLNDVNRLIKSCARQMNTLYGKIVFDEWAVVSLARSQPQVLAYTGPRAEEFPQNFTRDFAALRAQWVSGKYAVGDFEFTRQESGTGFESFLVLGRDLYLFCNNTQHSMDDLARDPKWLSAQVPFVELADQIRASPVVLEA
ncbi:MAG: hypothetical protein KA236_07310 [Verrucomicrobia bacterium]|jgi:hypothetical protein|nr:hypothetical protein [Verrucomicrobiota bacterium]